MLIVFCEFLVNRLEEERKILEKKFADQLAEQKKLAAEKDEVEEALRLRIQNLEKMAHREEAQQQQRQAEREKDEVRLSEVSTYQYFMLLRHDIGS